MSGWQYQYTSCSGINPSQVNDHLADMANAGWQLVSATALWRVGNEYHIFYWKKPRGR
jgi:hypothetical protein